MLPEDFINRMKDNLGSDFDDFINSYDKPKFQALRINTLKIKNKKQILDVFDKDNTKNTFKQVDWCENGYYYSEQIRPGKNPLHEAGAYYIQEPSAMSPAAYLAAKPGEVILDLCAAPGGKSTQIACGMNNQGLLISNEIVPSRAKILSENIERLGIRNAIVTNESSDRLLKFFPEFFDKIMVDAPCSGEGMFRKNSDASSEWSLDNVKMCASRQAEILDNAADMLKPGGTIVYSTCTFSKEENEDNIESFLERHSDFSISETKLYPGMSSGSIPGTIRLWPHKLNGEGHFLAVLKKNVNDSLAANDFENSSASKSNKKVKLIKGLSDKELKDYFTFSKNFLNEDLKGKYIRFGDQLNLVPDMCPDLNKLKVVRAGLNLGTFLKNRFEPSHSLALALSPSEVKNHMNIDYTDENIKKYINGEALEFEGEKGWYLITVDNISIGLGKLSGTTMKNHYPKGLRKML